MKVIVVDDEALALRSMEKVLNELGGIEVIGMYQDPRQVLEAVASEKPDVLFLDIEMPSMNGMKLAEKLIESEPRLNIVFVTAYSEYAVEAFEVNAIDYIVKPIRHDRVSRSLQRIQRSLTVESNMQVTEHVMIRCFRTLQIEFPGQEAEFIQWRTNKTQELFAYMIYHAGKQVRKDALIDILWPELPTAKAYTHLYTTVYQLRKTLSSLQVEIRITSGDEGYVLERNNVHIDVEVWEQCIRDTGSVTTETIEQARESMHLYRGSYLQEYDYAWAIDERERLGLLWFQHAIKITDYMMAIGMFSEAISLCHEIREQQPYVGYSYYMLMRIHAALGDRAKVRIQYQRLTEMLSEELGVQPEAEIIDWYTNWENQ